MVHISKENGKIGKAWNVSLAPWLTCRSDVPCMKDGCYAIKFMKMYPATRKAWEENAVAAIKDPDAFFAEVRAKFDAARKKPEYFRFHVGGDCPSLRYMMEAIWLARDYPKTSFYLPTKQYAWATWMAPVVPKNMVIALSAWPGLYMNNIRKLPVAWLEDGSDDRIPANAFQCASGCEECGHYCWKMKSGDSVVFHKHR